MSRFYVFIGHTRQRFTLLISALALLALIVAAQIGAVHAAPAPKAYVGLFKDNAVAVIDTGSNKVLTTIAVPSGRTDWSLPRTGARCTSAVTAIPRSA